MSPAIMPGPDAFQLTIRTAPNPIVRVDSDFSGFPVERLKENQLTSMGLKEKDL